MHLLKISVRKLNQEKIPGYYYCCTSYSSSFEIGFLGTFLEDFGSKWGLDFIKKILNDPSQSGTCGNLSNIDILDNGKISLSHLYMDENDTLHLEIDANVLLKITQMYIEAREATLLPKEIIIKLDSSMLIPTIESVY